MNKNDKKFIGFVVHECSKRNIMVRFEPTKYIQEVGEVGTYAGYFNEREGELVVATKMPFKQYLPTLVHEFAHFQQWKEKEPVYMKLVNNRHLDGDMWEYFEGKDIPMERVEKSVRAYQEMELDCEKRTIALMEKYELSADIEWYTRTANVYVLFYSIMMETRQWYKNSPTQNDMLCSIVNGDLIEDFELPIGFKEIAMSECY